MTSWPKWAGAGLHYHDFGVLFTHALAEQRTLGDQAACLSNVAGTLSLQKKV